MLDETYDIGAYNFFIVDGELEDYIEELYKIREQFNRLPYMYIALDFKYIDGLDVSDLFSFIPSKKFYIACAIQFKDQYYPVDLMKIDSQTENEIQGSKAIDKVYMNHLINSLCNQNKIDQKKLKVLRCFMERYICKTKEEVDEKINAINSELEEKIKKLKL